MKKEHMGLTTWADAPDGKIKKSDVTVVIQEYNSTVLENKTKFP